MFKNKGLHDHLPNSMPFKIQGRTTDRIYFMLQAAHHPDQKILEEQLHFNLPVIWHEFQDAQHQNRHIRLQVEPCEVFEVNYIANVARQSDISFERQQGLKEVPIPDLPDEVLPYLLASRYCNSDLLLEMAKRSFGWMAPGYTRVKAIEQWIYNNIFMLLAVLTSLPLLQMSWYIVQAYAVTSPI